METNKGIKLWVPGGWSNWYSEFASGLDIVQHVAGKRHVVKH